MKEETNKKNTWHYLEPNEHLSDHTDHIWDEEDLRSLIK